MKNNSCKPDKDKPSKINSQSGTDAEEIVKCPSAIQIENSIELQPSEDLVDNIAQERLQRATEQFNLHEQEEASNISGDVPTRKTTKMIGPTD